MLPSTLEFLCIQNQKISVRFTIGWIAFENGRCAGDNGRELYYK